MTHPWQSQQQWQLPYATQIPGVNTPLSFAHAPSPNPSYVPARPLSPSQRNPYSPEPQPSPGWSDGEYTGSGEDYTTPELESAGPSSLETNYPSLFPALALQSESRVSPTPVGLAALESPPNDLVRPDHTVNTMIRAALQESPFGKLPSRDIVKAIQNRFPFYADPGHAEKLRNTIRHHLSNAKGFVKLGKDADMKGKGDYWTYDPEATQVKAGIDVPGSTSTTGAARRRSPPAGASSPYPRPRRPAHRGSEDTITRRSMTTRSSQRIGPIRVSPKVRPSTRLALPDDSVPSNPRPIRPAAGRLTSTRLGGSQRQHPSHGLWSPRIPINSVPSSPEGSETVLDAPGGLRQQDIADRDGFVHTSFVPSPPTVASSPSYTSSPPQVPVPQISFSLAESSLFQIASTNQIPPYLPLLLPESGQTAPSPDFLENEDILNSYLNFEPEPEFPLNLM